MKQIRTGHKNGKAKRGMSPRAIRRKQERINKQNKNG